MNAMDTRLAYLQNTAKDTMNSKEVTVTTQVGLDEALSNDSVWKITVDSKERTTFKLPSQDTGKEIQLTGFSVVDVLDGGIVIGVVRGNATVHQMRGRAKIRILTDKGVVRQMSDKAQLESMYGNSTIGAMSGQSVVGYMGGESIVGIAAGTSLIVEMVEKSRVRQLFENSSVCYMQVNSVIEAMYDTSEVSEMLDSSEVTDVCDYSVINSMYEFSKVYNLQGHAQVRNMGGYSRVLGAKKAATISLMRDSSTVTELAENSTVINAIETSVIHVFGGNVEQASPTTVIYKHLNGGKVVGGTEVDLTGRLTDLDTWKKYVGYDDLLKSDSRFLVVSPVSSTDRPGQLYPSGLVNLDNRLVTVEDLRKTYSGYGWPCGTERALQTMYRPRILAFLDLCEERMKRWDVG